jgi:hypothetical protein
VSAILSLLKGGDGVDNEMLVLADWMGDDALKYFAVKKYGDVTDIVATERKRRETMKAKKIRDEETRIKEARKRFGMVIDKLSEEHRREAKLWRGWDACLKDNLSIFAKKDIDWVSECRSRLRALTSTCVGKACFVVSRRILRRKLVWKLMCMQYVYGKDVYAREVNNMLQAAAKQSDDRFRERIEKFISDTFADDVVLKWFLAASILLGSLGFDKFKVGAEAFGSKQGDECHTDADEPWEVNSRRSSVLFNNKYRRIVE